MEKNRIEIGAAQVHPLIARYMPMDGLDVVVDLYLKLYLLKELLLLQLMKTIKT